MRFTIFLSAVVCLPLALAAQRPTQDQAPRPGWPCAGKVDPAFVRTAEATGGKVLLFHPSEIEGVSLDERASRQHDVTIFRAAGQLDGDSYEFTIPIDSTIESAYVSVSVQCLQTVTLLTPAGQEFSAGAPGVEYHQFEALRMFVVPRPAAGPWKAIASGRGFFAIRVMARTPLSLSHVAWPDAGATPGGGQAVSLEATVSGPARQAAFSFVAANGAPIGPVQLALEDESADRRTYRGPVVRPSGDFRVTVSGVDASGIPFQRMENRLSIVGSPSDSRLPTIDSRLPTLDY
jgi:hypothetical protein